MSKKKDTVEQEVVQTFQYTTSKGIKVTLYGMPPLLPNQIQNSVKRPEIPTYTVQTAGGGVEVWEHSKDTISTDEERAEWEAYETGIEKADNLVTERLLRAILLECVEVDEFAERFDVWKAKQKMIGIDLPEDEEEQILLFKEVEIFRSADAITYVMEKVMQLTGVSREEIDDVKSSFPD